jgi:penicillin-binding protein 2
MIGPGPSASGGGGGPREDDRTPVMSSQLALRVAIVGSVALLMFAVIFLRLWFLQVLTGNQAVASARGNITRKVPTAAPRGSILASNGSLLVDSVKVPAVLIEPQELPVPLKATSAGVNNPAADQTIYTRLEQVLGMKTAPDTCKYELFVDNDADKIVPKKFTSQLPEIPCIIAQHASEITTGTVTIATNIPDAEQAFISERQDAYRNLFPGVEVTQVSVSQYPLKTLAAQLLGTIGANSDSSTGKALFADVPAYDNVGQTGLEYEYNKYLQGKDGYERVEVNAQGEYQGEGAPVSSTTGYNLKTSIDPALERVGSESLQRSIDAVGKGSNGGGAFVAMDPDNGQVYGMGSLPSYDPTVFTKPLTQAQFDSQFGTSSNDPLYDRAIQSVGPDGSTFKVITATAALESGVITATTPYDDTGRFCPTPGVTTDCKQNSGGAAYGVVDLTKAIQVSDDVYFYHLGQLLNADPTSHPNGGALQTWARKYGIGQKPPIDLPYASAGTLPTPKYVDHQIKLEQECDTATGIYSYTNGIGGISAKKLAGYHRSPKHAPGGCELVSYPYEYWTVGDNINAAVGQGDVQVSPLQLARVYATIANGGKLVTPHIGEDIQTSTGSVVEKISAPSHNIGVSPTTLASISEGLREAAQSGTSADVMGTFGKPVYGKTGTAQYIPTSGPSKGEESDYSWYACYVPDSATSKPIVVVVWVENGGFGDVSAAPVARQILSQWFYKSAGDFVQGSSADQ